MKYTCPKCGKHIELSVEALIASEYKTVCPQCLTRLEIVGDYAYVPLDDGSLDLHRNDTQEQPDNQFVPPVPPVEPVPMQVDNHPDMPAEHTQVVPGIPVQPVAPAGKDPLFDEAVRFLGQCSAITPMMLRDYFGIPMERAQQLINQLEQAGCIGPYRGGAPRKILIDHYQGLPSVYQQQQRYDPNAPQQAMDGQQQEGKEVKMSCGGCFFWILLFMLIIFIFLQR